jgi:hypothetical protein
MKYAVNFSNIQIANMGSIEDINFTVEYSVGELPELVGKYLPFIKEMANEVVPNLMEKFNSIDEARYARRAEQAIKEDALRHTRELELIEARHKANMELVAEEAKSHEARHSYKSTF